MTASALKPNAEDRDRAYRSRVKDEVLPSVIIDCASAVVLAANAGGLNALGLTPADRLPAALDSAMPAVAMLRDLQRRGLGATSRHMLIFWRHGRIAARMCDVSVIAPESPAHALVVFRPESDTALQTSAGVSKDTGDMQFSNAAAAANDDAPPRIVRDDCETLKEIARRIREGQSNFKSEPELVKSLAEDLETTAADPQPVGHANNTLDWPAQPTSIIAGSASIASRIEPPIETQAREPASIPPAQPHRNLSRALPPEDIAKLAHELKTPLSAIAAAAEIMRDEQLGPMGNDKYLGYAADIHESASHALAVIAEMLAAAPQTGHMRDLGSAFDLSDLAARTVSSLQPLAGQRTLTLALDADAGLLPIRANPTSVRQILLNLLTNALKFTPPGGDVRVGTGYLDDGAIYLVVRDTGDGMTTDALAHAFDDTTDAMAMRAGGGRGIGLRLVRRLSAENGAEFEIDSQPGRGTTVMLVFPKDLVGEV